MPEDTSALIGLVVVIATVLVYLFLCVSTARHSWNRYGYRIYLNWINLWYLLYIPILLIGSFYGSTGATSNSFVWTLLAVSLIPISVVGINNVRKTSLLFGVWATLVQASSVLLLVALHVAWTNGKAEAERRGHGA
jgi:hypothetical protein